MSWKTLSAEMDPAEMAYREGVMDCLEIINDLKNSGEDVDLEDLAEIIEETLLGLTKSNETVN